MEKPVDCGINGDRLDQPTSDGKSAMPGKRVQFDDETWNALDLLAKDRMQDFQELADEAFSDLLRKHGRPTDLKTALRRSVGTVDQQPGQPPERRRGRTKSRARKA
jgi:hypothetical protein